jgi:hypothetical protein
MQVNTFGFKNTYGIDLGASIMIYQQNSDVYQKSECYNNAFYCIDKNIETYRYNRVIIGYVLSTDGVKRVAVRHAWNEINGIKVDVTMIANDEHPLSIISYTYLPIQVYKPADYIDAVIANDNKPWLPKTAKEHYYIRELKKKGFEVLE